MRCHPYIFPSHMTQMVDIWCFLPGSELHLMYEKVAHHYWKEFQCPDSEHIRYIDRWYHHYLWVWKRASDSTPGLWVRICILRDLQVCTKVFETQLPWFLLLFSKQRNWSSERVRKWQLALELRWEPGLLIPGSVPFALHCPASSILNDNDNLNISSWALMEHQHVS